MEKEKEKIDFNKIYRECGSPQDFARTLRDEHGIDEDEALEIYWELEHKYIT